jgi:tricorn protease interacting factor F2/3
LRIESYDLSLDIDFYKAKVLGRVGVTVVGAASPFSLDSISHRIRSVKVNGKRARFKLDAHKSKLKVYSVPRRRSLVEIEYEKEVSDATIFGLYKARYGKEYLLTTDLEPAEARTVFPCVDEPLYKAVFRLQITTQKGLSAISNTPAARVEQVGDARTRFVFEETPRMSTYLFHFTVGKIEEQSVMSGDVEVIGAARPGQSRNMQFVMDVAAGVLADYQKYFEVPYPLQKLHIVAVPEFHTGAMENWGAIASRESYALINDDSAFRERVKAATSITHEIGHQWFGDLVTMRWWDDLWLNESFATLMEYKMTDRLHPGWGIWDAFLVQMAFRGQNLDALSTTHPVQMRIGNVEEVSHAFDAISYNKGGSVLRMLEAYVGEEAFRRGVSEYLKKFSYSNATGKDLWRSLGAASRLPVSRVARAWLTMPGFPVVKVSTHGDDITLSQSQFRLTGRPRGTWPIPVNIRKDGKVRSFMFDRKSMNIKDGAASDLVVNADRIGFYSVLYDEAGHERLAKIFQRLSPQDRSGLMTDLFLFLQAGMVSPEVYFRFLTLAGGTPDSLTVSTTTEQLELLRAIADEAPLLRSVYSRYYTPLLRVIGEERRPGEPEALGTAREALTTQFALIDEGYAARLAPRFEDYGHLDPNLRKAVAVSYAVTNGAAARDPLLKLVRTMEVEVDRSKIYAALTSFRDPQLVIQTLELCVSGEVSRSDLRHPLVNAATNPYARVAVWGWIKDRYDKLMEIYGASQQFYIFMGFSMPICGAGHEADVRGFLSAKRLKDGGSSYTRGLELLGVFSRLRERLLATKDSGKQG